MFFNVSSESESHCSPFLAQTNRSTNFQIPRLNVHSLHKLFLRHAFYRQSSGFLEETMRNGTVAKIFFYKIRLEDGEDAMSYYKTGKDNITLI